jgi:hypothetical protein
MLGDSNVSNGSEAVRHFLIQRRRDIQAGLERRLRQGVADGDLPADADVNAMAAFYMTVMQGLSLRARDAASRESLLQVVDSAMAAWDSLAGRQAAPRPSQARGKRARAN